MVKTLVSDHLP